MASWQILEQQILTLESFVSFAQKTWHEFFVGWQVSICSMEKDPLETQIPSY